MIHAKEPIRPLGTARDYNFGTYKWREKGFDGGKPVRAETAFVQRVDKVPCSQVGNSRIGSGMKLEVSTKKTNGLGIHLIDREHLIRREFQWI